MILTFDFNLTCRTSLRRCSRDSPGGWSWLFYLKKLAYKGSIPGRFTEKTMMIDLKNYEILGISNFFGESHLGVVLEVLLVVFKKKCKYNRKIHRKKLGWLLYKWRRCLTFWTLEKEEEKRIMEVSIIEIFGNLKIK